MMSFSALLATVTSSLWLATALPAEPTRLAEAGGQIWIGTERGLYRLGERGPEPVWLGAPIRDLAGTPEELWIASPRGLARWTQAGGVQMEPPLAPGAQVLALAISGPDLVAATEAGLFSGRAGRFERDASLPAGAVDSVASAGPELWVARRGAVYRRGPDARFAARWWAQPPGWWELLDVLPDGSLLVPEGLRTPGAPEQRIAPLRAPLRAAVALGERAALASATQLALLGPGTRSELLPLPAAADDLRDLLVRSDGSLLVLCSTGLLELRLESDPLVWRTLPPPDDAIPPAAPAAVPGPAHRGPEDVPISALHAAALRYLELTPGRMTELETRSRRALWLPQLQLSSGVQRESTRARERSQTFNSGGIRDLRDGSRDDQGNWDFDLKLVWDLPGGVNPAPQLQVSRERRDLIELRDQVLERVDRAYFELLRVRARRTWLAPDAEPERIEFEIRERELTAQLDAWTGGAFSALATAPTP